MSRLDDYRTALLVAHPDVAVQRLVAALDERPTEFSRFVIDMGLGPLWHQRTGREEFHESRLQAEAPPLRYVDGERHCGVGRSHDIVQASLNAILGAINKAAQSDQDAAA